MTIRLPASSGSAWRAGCMRRSIAHSHRRVCNRSEQGSTDLRLSVPAEGRQGNAQREPRRRSIS
jgi:hypothetical protein